MRAACSNRDLIVFFATSQALATWAIVSGIKWLKQTISMEKRLTDKLQKAAEGHYCKQLYRSSF